VIKRTELRRSDRVDLFFLIADHDHRHVFARGHHAQLLEHLIAVDPRHDEIEDHEVVPFGCECCEGLFARAAKAKVMAPPDLANLVESLLKRRLLSGLGLARR